MELGQERQRTRTAEHSRLEEGVLTSEPAIQTASDNSERTLTYEQYSEVMKTADMLQQLTDGEELKRRVQQKMAEMGIDKVGEENVFPISSVYRMGEQMGYPKDLVQRAMDMRFPSTETMLEDMAETGATISQEQRARIYKKFLLKELKSKYPLINWIIVNSLYNPEVHFTICEETTTEISSRGFFRRMLNLTPKVDKKVHHQELAEFAMYDEDHARINVYSPIILNGVKQILKKLNKYFEINPPVNICYPVDISDELK